MRHNELVRQVYAVDGNWIEEQGVTENHALMMYAPLLGEQSSRS